MATAGGNMQYATQFMPSYNTPIATEGALVPGLLHPRHS